GRGRNGNDSRDWHDRGDTNGDCTAQRMAGEDSAFGDDGLARNEVTHEGARTRLCASRRKWTWRGSMAGEIRREDAQILLGELLRAEGHDFLFRGQAVKENNRAERRAGAWLVYVG